MYYVVPKGRSIMKQQRSFELLRDAKLYALQARENTGENFDIICMERVWTTQTLGELMKNVEEETKVI